MKGFTRFFPLLCAMLLLLCACTTLGDAPAALPSPSHAQPTPDATAAGVQLQAASVYRQTLSFSEEPTAPVFLVQIECPQTDNAACNAYLAQCLAQIEAQWQTELTASEHIEFLTAELADASLKMTQQTALLAQRVLSVCWQGSVDCFGHEKKTALRCATYDCVQQKALQGSDVFLPGYEPLLATACLDVLRADGTLAAQLGDDAIAADEATLCHWRLCAEGLDVYFAPGKIADPALGVLHAKLAWSQLEQIVQPQWLQLGGA